MLDSIRCKMSPGAAVRGAKGNQLSMNCVYEGSPELQEISENAMFGNATPSGFLDITGDDVPIDKFDTPDEYYVDMWPSGQVRTGYLLTFPVRKTFQSGPNPSYPDSPTQFRFYATSVVTGSFSISIMNPVAIGFLDDKEHFVMGIKLARGRKSDAEIALRQSTLDKFIEDAGTHSYWGNNKDAYNQYVATLRRKLAIAKGEILD